MAEADTAGAALLKRLDAGLAKIENVCALLGGFLVFASMFLVVAEVVSRRLFNAPIPGMLDMFDVGLAAVSLLGAAYCQRLGGHVRMEFLTGTLTGRRLWLAEALTAALALFFIAAVAVSGFHHALRAYRIDDVTIDILLPLWPSKAVVPLALGILSVRLAVNLAGYIRLVIDPAAAPAAIPVVESVADHALADAGEVAEP